MDLANLESKIQHSFSEKGLLLEALTHSSYFHENPKASHSHNERLEFLGDAVLELIVTEELFHRFPDYEEGSLTSFRAALVNYQMMAQIARDIELEKFLLLSRGEAKDTGRAREVILANAVEALIGAIYLDGGYDAAKKIVVMFVMPHLDEVFKQGLYKDAKSLFQERTQEKFKITPTYRVLEETGPDHHKTFVVGVYLKEKLVAEGSGHSKQDAEIEAAREALRILEGKSDE